MIKLNVWGGAGEHGRSAYLLSGSRYRLLLDCGVKKEGNGEYPLIEPEIVPQLDAVLLSHAHEDHSVAIPLLYKLGYTGEVWTTRETKEQLTTYFRSWRNNMERAGQSLPYDEVDEKQIRYRFLEDEAEREYWFELLPGVSVMWGRTGHLAGSVWFGLEMEDKRILYSGDYTLESILLQADDVADGFRQADLKRQRLKEVMPVASVAGGAQRLSWSSNASVTSSRQAVEYAPLEVQMESVIRLDLAIIDAAYGTDRDAQADKLQQLESAIQNALHQGGKVLLPMPAVGRGQELILWAQQRFADIPLIVEQRLVDGMKQLHRASFWLRELEGEVTESAPAHRIATFLSGEGWESVSTTEERTTLLEKYEASLWFIPDGMMQSPLARWYYGMWAPEMQNLILLTGHTSTGTFAHQLLENSEQYGTCRVEKVRYKVHQGWNDVERMLNRVSARHNVLVHTDIAETERLRQGLLVGQSRSGTDIDLLSPGDELIF
ncbi:Beta-Casp domain-containing protein [Paenibacillus polysaccharolyticus]|uniref:Beta-Casp domain-containing protein n=1 Tax=Paenibacillus polysaccharolyticus TaxID=582692 RepID=A0A1G5H9R9_9BACL|nr:MBL fold metallo-hydrolase [Paenibacillus polysaccharolyticus]SCY60464.1 Beta-Casp domain-containing protein [Paenibacillus polysaccharolyticus]